MRLTTIILTVVLLVASSCGRKTPEDLAIERAKVSAARYLKSSGVDNRSLTSVSLRTIAEREVPSAIFRKVGNGQVVQLDYEGVLLPGWITRKRNVSLLIDAVTGLLLKATIPARGEKFRTVFGDELDSIEQMLYDRGMRFVGLPESTGVSLETVLAGCPYGWDGERMSAVFVTESSYTGDIRSCWFVAVPQHSPEPIAGVPGVPDSLLNKHPYTCSIFRFDGGTGRLLSSGSF
jgi:hypothetical protein